jgi:hypothetical protein
MFKTLKKLNKIKIGILFFILTFTTFNIVCAITHSNYGISPFRQKPKVEIVSQDNDFINYIITTDCKSASNRDLDINRLNPLSNNIGMVLGSYAKTDYPPLKTSLVLRKNVNTPLDVTEIQVVKNLGVKLWFNCGILNFPMNAFYLKEV